MSVEIALELLLELKVEVGLQVHDHLHLECNTDCSSNTDNNSNCIKNELNLCKCNCNEPIKSEHDTVDVVHVDRGFFLNELMYNLNLARAQVLTINIV